MLPWEGVVALVGSGEAVGSDAAVGSGEAEGSGAVVTGAAVGACVVTASGRFIVGAAVFGTSMGSSLSSSDSGAAVEAGVIIGSAVGTAVAAGPIVGVAVSGAPVVAGAVWGEAQHRTPVTSPRRNVAISSRTIHKTRLVFMIASSVILVVEPGQVFFGFLIVQIQSPGQIL